MDSVFKDFITKAKRIGVCKEYADKVDNAGSKKAFMEIALSAGALPWVSEMIARGELLADTISKEFKPFNNGAYTRDKDGYTSQMYCLPECVEIAIGSTTTLIIDFKGVIKIDRPICELYICNSDVTIVGCGRGVAYLYNSTITNPDTANVVIKEDNRY